ncbi:hypothetical protein [Calothrix sp. 336/3]|uniref:hypothetical protein n=1 Tax=Calothrix sp. 336/3 TaxID=1337936 RepID=UPI00143C753C|nr:hypothetical protein [Calothrix sp. 336/3]
MQKPPPTENHTPQKPPAHTTTTEWIAAFQTWATNHRHDTPPLSNYAVSRESMYEDERL